MSEEKVKNVFCGILPSGNSQAILQIVMAKTDATPAALREAFAHGRPIDLVEPVLIHRVMGMNRDERTGQQTLVITHQMLDDPYWPSYRGAKLLFGLIPFLSVRVMDTQNAKDLEEIGRYENSLSQKWAKAQGLVLP